MFQGKNILGFQQGLFVKSNAQGLAVGLLVMLVGLAIGQSDSTLSLSLTKNIVFFMQMGLSLYIILKAKRHKDTTSLLTLALLAYWFVIVIYKAPNVGSGLAIPTLILTITYLSISKEQLIVAVKFYGFLFFIQCLLGLVAYSDYILGIGLPHETASFYSDNALNNFYVNYHFSYIILDINNYAIRLCGLFNEPGYLGTFAAFILILNKFKLNVQNAIIFIAACFTFSMAFFVIVILYWGCRTLTEGKKAPIIIAVAYLIFNIVVPQIKTDNASYDRLLNRFIIEDNKVAGDNRAGEELDREYELLKNDAATFMFGKGYGYFNNKEYSSVTTKKWIIEYGVIGFVFFFGIFFLAGLTYSKKANGKKSITAVIYLVLFFINTYNRPYLYNFDYIILMFGGILLLVEEDNQCLKIQNS